MEITPSKKMCGASTIARQVKIWAPSFIHWPWTYRCAITIGDERGDFSRVQGHHQITDLYLLALAVGNGGRLATFDQAISLASMKGAAARHSHLL